MRRGWKKLEKDSKRDEEKYLEGVEEKMERKGKGINEEKRRWKRRKVSSGDG